MNDKALEEALANENWFSVAANDCKIPTNHAAVLSLAITGLKDNLT